MTDSFRKYVFPNSSQIALSNVIHFYYINTGLSFMEDAIVYFVGWFNSYHIWELI
jgi:hypothetical protein